MTEAVQKIAESYECKPIEGMLSHQLEQNTIDGEKTIIQNPSEAQRKEHDKFDFELHEVYAVDVLISTGEGQVSPIPGWRKERELVAAADSVMNSL